MTKIKKNDAASLQRNWLVSLAPLWGEHHTLVEWDTETDNSRVTVSFRNPDGTLRPHRFSPFVLTNKGARGKSKHGRYSIGFFHRFELGQPYDGAFTTRTPLAREIQCKYPNVEFKAVYERLRVFLVTFDPSWNTETVHLMCKQYLADKDKSITPILADALQDAGCEVLTILEDLRSYDPWHIEYIANAAVGNC